MAINWDEVKVGETEIVSPRNEKWLVVGSHNLTAWLFRDGVYYQIRIDGTSKWTLDDPWEEITNECEWVRIDDTLMVFLIQYKGQVIANADPNFKSDGRRVFKRKERP